MLFVYKTINKNGEKQEGEIDFVSHLASRIFSDRISAQHFEPKSESKFEKVKQVRACSRYTRSEQRLIRRTSLVLRLLRQPRSAPDYLHDEARPILES